MPSQRSEPIAIVGSGCRFPGGVNSSSALWQLLENPRDVCQDITQDRFDTRGYYHPDGGHHGTTNVQQCYLLETDPKVFDAGFFNINPNEADSIDPQQRLILETVYEALESGGHTIESLRGSDTAVYVGCMGVDYNDTITRDLNTLPTYFATGTNRAIISNRVSYFFDWHGPSMTIDTACSSSLIAVHQGVQTLRAGESNVVVACGTQVILGPEVFIYESKMNMLSPTGRSRMWDAEADGYARGEGVAAIVLKRLSDAIADGDHIECIIRETGTNQDGHSSGLTVPSSEAQAALIRQTYARAGLDPKNNPQDRPQFFEAHGTGTKMGDPKEAAAIQECFGRRGDNESPLYVGSVKTIIGHTEGAAGLAGILKGSEIIQKGFIPPNLLFNSLNPAIEPFYQGLHVPTSLTPWPELCEGVPRRVSVNSFGFGGSNAHAILEEYRKPSMNMLVAARSEEPEKIKAPFTPFVFSAASEVSLTAQLKAYSEFLQTHNSINPSDLAWTLQSRRSQLPLKAAFSAPTIEQLRLKIDKKLAEVEQNPSTSIGTRSNSKTATHRILGVFTGQGAQWAAMGGHLIRSSEFVRKRLRDLEESLTTLPPPDRPQWRLQDEMLAGAETSRISEAELSQPLCTAIQIILVDLLETAGVKFSAVVGHSSGEIGAAYAAGFISDRDAIRIAYYRGFHARLAGNSSNGQKGAMLAVGTSWEDAQDLVNLRAFKGRLAIAAHNSGASVTLSGDADAVILAKKIFDEEKKFARLLKVDTAYHSHHMLPCGDPYVQSLRACGVRVIRERPDTSCSWFSSVTPGDKGIEPSDELQDVYWRDNMTNAVLFADAIKNAVTSDVQLRFALEVGPHPALKGPATQNISEASTALPYGGVLSRGQNDVEVFSDALGTLWANLGTQAVDFESYEKAVSSPSADEQRRKLVVDLPSYQWNHARTHWHESRRSRKIRGRKQPFHELLGLLSPDSTDRDWRWTNLLKVSEIPWLDGHKLQGQTVFPATAYIALALEAARAVAGDRAVQLFEVHDLTIPKAITFEEDVNSAVETLVTLTAITTRDLDQDRQDQTTNTSAEFSCYATSSVGSAQELELIAKGTVNIIFGALGVPALSSLPLDVTNLLNVETDRFYSSLLELGYCYSDNFRGMSSLKRRLNQSSAQVDTYAYKDTDSTVYLVHPTTLDVVFQTSMLAFAAPGDGRLWSLHVPTSLGTIRVSPEVCASTPTSASQVPVCTVVDESGSLNASIDVFSEDGQQTMIQVEDLSLNPFAPATEADDHRLFLQTKWDFATPDGASVIRGARPSADEVEQANACERLSYYYLCKWKSELTDEEWVNGQPHHLPLRDYMNHILSTVGKGQHPFVRKEWGDHTDEDIKAIISQYKENIDIKLLAAVGENIPAAVRGETTILEHMVQNNMLDDFYKNGLGFARYNSFLASMVKQITHRYPHSRILEIGAGTGGATKSILESVGNTISSYTYTDVSVGFFERAAELFSAYSDKMTFKVLDVEKAPVGQGYEPHSYDIVIASNVLHATTSLQRTLEHTRQLLKPGGYLMLLEITQNANSGPIRFSNVMGGLPGWWVGGEDGRQHAPTITPREWHAALRRAGFAGVDAVTPEIDVLPWTFSIMAAQAVDNRVDFLRRPLAKTSTPIYIESLVIIGTGSLESSRIAEDIADYLGHFCGQTTTLNGLPTEAEALTLSPMSTFINLVDLDSPIFKNMSADRMDGLKRLFDLAKHVLWITLGAQADEPYHMASIAFNRAIRHEIAHISLNHLDVSDLDHNVSKVIAEHLLRQYALEEWKVQSDGQRNPQLLWSTEPELFLDSGRLMIPRLVGNVDQNDRLNSSRRTITRTVTISDSNISIVPSASSPPSLVEEVLPVALEAGQRRIRVQSSSLMALRVAEDALLFLGIGEDKETGSTVFSLSATNSSETIPIATVPAGSNSTSQSSEGLLISVASELISTSLVETLSPGSSILVHCSIEDRFFTAALSRRAAAKGVGITFTCDVEYTNDPQDQQWIGLNPRAPRHVLRRKLLPAKPTHFLDLTSDSRINPSGLSLGIARVLPSGYKQLNSSDFSRPESQLLLPPSGREVLVSRLEDAVSRATFTSREQAQDLIIQLDQINPQSTPSHATSVINWELDGDVRVNVQPLDVRRLFSKKKTYLLVGLTGQIGQSLCEWMISNGAGCVCLTSRNPNIDETWLESFKAIGATVKVFAMDITNKQSLKRVVDDIRTTCPPIGGVANGAMVLHDSLFSGSSLEAMQKVLGPKIDGSNNLDELFHDDKLDFFILFSSGACVIGNSGQANYGAGCGYMTSLVRKRRNRGLAASSFDIGRVVGVGYVEQVSQVIVEQLTKYGYMAISESEFHQMFAETICAGYAHPDTNPVITTGIRTVRDDEESKVPWFDNPRFSHCIERATGINTKKLDKKTALPVMEQISNVETMDEALAALTDSFVAKLRATLQLSDQEIDHNLPLVELGIDSLVAVEVRSWFLKELKVDMPVLKLLGGAPLADICDQALAKVPEHLPSTKKESTNPTVTQSKSEPQSTDSVSTSSGRTTPPTPPSTDKESVMDLSTKLSPIFSTPQETAIEESKKTNRPPPASAARAPTYLKTEQISFAQSRFWFLGKLVEDPTTFNVSFYYRVAGNLRVNDLDRAIRAVCARHEGLRTCIVGDETEAEMAYQKVIANSTLRLEHKTGSSIEEVSSTYANLKAHIFDLGSGEMMRIVALTVSPSLHYLLFNYHHIVMDGFSHYIFLTELEKVYNGQSLGPPPRQFPDFSRNQRMALANGDMADDLKFWRGIFPDNPPVLPLLPMARVSSRMPMTVFDTHQVKYQLDPELVGRIRSASKAQRSTAFHFYLATFKSMLFLFTNAQDLTIGIADANRNDNDVEHTIGFLLNLLTLRFRRQPAQHFSDAVVEARNTAYTALGNSRLPFDVLLEELNIPRSSEYSPFFQAFFNYRAGSQNKHPWGNCQFELEEMHPGRTAYDITLDVMESTEEVLVLFRVQKGLYDLEATNLMLKTYLHLLDVLSRDVSIPLKDTPLFSQNQLTHALGLGRGPNLTSSWPSTLPHRIDQIAEEHPNKVALMDDLGNDLTYSDMISRIEAIAQALQNAGVGTGSRVLVFQQATSDWVCSMLAIMRTGAVYVPLDLRNPLPRLAAVAKDCQPLAVLADDTTSDDARQLGIPEAAVVDVSRVELKSPTSVPNLALSDSPAAILYTSGSTGTPKGIIVTHSGLRNEIEGYTKMWKLGAERVLQQSAFTFNHSSDQMYTGLVNGGMVYVVPWSKRGDPLEITKIIQKHNITYTKATPSEYSLWIQYGSSNLRQAYNWRFAFGGGEPLTSTVTQEFSSLRLPLLRFFNSYGPTEISISSTKMEIGYREELPEGRIPCGYSLPNYVTYILDEQLKPVPAGMPGEIVLGGAGVSQGYLNNKELTDKHFVPDPYATPEYLSRGWTRMYRTGDIGHLQNDGAMVFHRRMAGDVQVKIRGLRIELADIESNILSAAHGALREGVVTLHEGDPEFLVAHVVFAPQHAVTDKEGFLQQLLRDLPVPQYMIPVLAIPLDRLPLTNHSKVDRRAIKALPLPSRAKSADNDLELTETMVQLRHVWQDVLKTQDLGFSISPSTSFFTVGGNSLLVIRLQSRIRETFNVVVRLAELLSANTLGEMARKIEESCSTDIIDWDKETALPDLGILGGINTRPIRTSNKTVLVTGATGFLAKFILPQLAKNPNILAIHCVAVRNNSSQSPRSLPISSSKVVSHSGDLSAPLLGLPENDFQVLSNEVDVILHMGSQRSFWDNYNLLRASNVHPTKELIKLAAPRRIPIHYISTAGLLPRGVDPVASSVAAYVPAIDGSEGYVATKWASERILEQAASTLGLPTAVYRFIPPAEKRPATERELDEFVRFVDMLKVIPDFDNWKGHFDMIPGEQVANWLCEAIVHEQVETNKPTTRFTHYESPITVDMAAMASYIEQKRGDQGFEQMPGLRWLGRTKSLGFKYFFTSQDIAVQSGGVEGGVKFESRR